MRRDGLGEDVSAPRRGARVPVRDEGARDARQGRAATAGVLASRGRKGPHRGVQDVTWQFTLTGLLIGIIVGLTGMGGGALLTPILVIVFGFKPTYAVRTHIFPGA